MAAVISQLARDDGVQQPALQVLIYPATDYVSTTRSRTLFADGFFLTKRGMERFRHNYLDGADVDASDPRVSPLMADDLSGLCPALVLTGGFDPLRDEGSQYAEAMRAVDSSLTTASSLRWSTALRPSFRSGATALPPQRK